jgi:hypothetical protein
MSAAGAATALLSGAKRGEEKAMAGDGMWGTVRGRERRWR